MSVLSRRCFRFGLWALFVLVTVSTCWFGYELNWIRQRHSFLARHEVMRADLGRRLSETPNGYFGDRVSVGAPISGTPGQLGMFGETMVPRIDFAFFGEPSNVEWHEVELARRLFPEAEIEWRPIRTTAPAAR